MYSILQNAVVAASRRHCFLIIHNIYFIYMITELYHRYRIVSDFNISDHFHFCSKRCIHTVFHIMNVTIVTVKKYIFSYDCNSLMHIELEMLFHWIQILAKRSNKCARWLTGVSAEELLFLFVVQVRLQLFRLSFICMSSALERSDPFSGTEEQQNYLYAFLSPF